MKVKVHKIAGGADMRSKTIVGEIMIMGKMHESRLPEIGEIPIVMNTKPLEDLNATGRMFNTSAIVSYTDSDKGRLVVTGSGSQYLFETL